MWASLSQLISLTVYTALSTQTQIYTQTPITVKNTSTRKYTYKQIEKETHTNSNVYTNRMWSLRALIVSRRVHVHPHPLSTVHPTYLLKLLPSSQFKVYGFTHFLCNISPSNYITCLHLCKYMPSTAKPIVQNIVLFPPCDQVSPNK